MSDISQEVVDELVWQAYTFASAQALAESLVDGGQAIQALVKERDNGNIELHITPCVPAAHITCNIAFELDDDVSAQRDLEGKWLW